MTRTVLIIAYYFPPLGMGGVQRMAKLAKYLPDFAYDVVVLTVKQIRYPAHDPSLLEDLPAAVEIHRAGSSDPARVGRFLPLPAGAGSSMKTIAREHSGRFWPDSKAGWQRPAIRLAEKIFGNRKIDVILSSAPPISGHVVAMELKRRHGVPWVADFRDIWESRPPEQLFTRKSTVDKSYRLLEDIVGSADAVTQINDSITSAVSDRAVTIMGGYDPDDFSDLPVVAAPDRFIMCYMGTVGRLHPVEPFFEAARIAASRSEEFAARMHFEIIGANDAREMRRVAARHKLKDQVTIVGYLPHRAALHRAAMAALSLLSVPRGHPEILTGKIFDYVALPAPILASAPSAGEIAGVLDTYHAGVCVEPENPPALAEAMLELFRRQRQGETWVKKGIEGFTRSEAARQFAGLFDRIIHDR